MAILSIDLAHTSYANMGGVILAQDQPDKIACEFLSIPLTGQPSARDLAFFLDESCTERSIRVLLIDGPQAWKSPWTALPYARVCEDAFSTPAKTGLPGMVKPEPYTPFAEFSVALFDALALLGWERLEASSGSTQHRIMAESFPSAGWKTLGLKPLSAKPRKPALADRLADLQVLFPMDLPRDPSHDELQAIVAGLAGLAMERGDWDDCSIRGVAPWVEDGLWREGWIVAPLQRSAAIPSVSAG